MHPSVLFRQDPYEKKGVQSLLKSRYSLCFTSLFQLCKTREMVDQFL